MGPSLMKAGGKRVVRQTLAKAGIWIGRPSSLFLNYHVVALLNAHSADCVLDVGANRGQFGTALRQAGYCGPILSFEPVSEAFRELQERSAHDPAWTAHQTAMGDESGMLSLNISASPSVSSFLRITDDYVATYAAAKIQRTEQVPVTTIDEVARDLPYQRLFLKSDTQGYDLRVLKGAAQTIKSRVVGIQIEMSVVAIYEGMPDYLEALTTMRDIGFIPTGMYPVASDPIYEFDGVFVRG